MITTTHITRRKSLLDHSAAREISLTEWMNVVSNDPEMRLDNKTKVTLANGELYEYTNPGVAVFLNRKAGESAVKEIVFDFSGGSIITKNADRETMKKVRLLAFKLNARIFRETPSTTVELPVSFDAVQPLFRFRDAFAPFAKLALPFRYLWQYFASVKMGHKESTVASPSNTPQAEL